VSEDLSSIISRWELDRRLKNKKNKIEEDVRGDSRRGSFYSLFVCLFVWGLPGDR
jgi:hypothetical protein